MGTLEKDAIVNVIKNHVWESPPSDLVRVWASAFRRHGEGTACD
jgi:hypothetical protein